MRIIGGKFKRKKLAAVPGASTRPTSDRLRESLFNILAGDVADAVVLDLFAGTGALGIEALSRHAHSAVFVDNQSKAVSVINKNIDACSLEKNIKVYKWDITRNLNCLSGREQLFDLVFIDPPYNLEMIPKTLANLVKIKCLKNDAVIVVEHSSSESVGEIPDCCSMTDIRQYGKTSVTFLVYNN